MQEKIAKEIYEGITGLPWPPDDTETRYTREKCMRHAAAILSLPVEGFEVKEKCLHCKGTGEAPEGCISCKGKDKCQLCNNGFISRPLTLGELPEMARKTREALEMCKAYYDSLYDAETKAINDALTFKDKEEK